MSGTAQSDPSTPLRRGTHAQGVRRPWTDRRRVLDRSRIVELLVIDDSDRSSHANDWGEPSHPGVLLVHAGPGVLAALAIGAAWRQSAKPSALTGEAELGSAKVRASASRAAPGDPGARPMRRAEGRCRRAVRLCGDVADGVTRPATVWPSTCASTTKRTQYHPCQGTDDHRCIPGEAFSSTSVGSPNPNSPD